MDFRRTEGALSIDYVGKISEDEAKLACPRLSEVQVRLDEVVALAGNPKQYKNAGAYGSAVHTAVARSINQTRNPRFFAERSFLKEQIELDVLDWARYGQSETLRADIIEHVDDHTVCGYDLKTGKAVFGRKRAAELLGGMKRHFPFANRFIMMQIKPRL